MNVYVASVTLLPVTSNPLQTLLQALLRLGPKRPVHVTGGYPPGWIESGIGYKKNGFSLPRHPSGGPSLLKVVALICCLRTL